MNKNIAVAAWLVTTFLICSLTSANAQARNPKEPFVLDKSDIKYVYDGDSIYINCRPEYRCTKGKLGIRALALDTPEMKGECEEEIVTARLAKQHLVTLKNDAKRITVYPNGKRLYDKYGRLLASIKFDDRDWATSIIDSSLGRKWNGQRGGWCGTKE